MIDTNRSVHITHRIQVSIVIMNNAFENHKRNKIYERKLSKYTLNLKLVCSSSLPALLRILWTNPTFLQEQYWKEGTLTCTLPPTYVSSHLIVSVSVAHS